MLDRTLPRMIVIKNDLAPELWRIKADRVQLDQMLMNLAINAKDAMPDGGGFNFQDGQPDFPTQNGKGKT